MEKKVHQRADKEDSKTNEDTPEFLDLSPSEPEEPVVSRSELKSDRTIVQVPGTSQNDTSLDVSEEYSEPKPSTSSASAAPKRLPKSELNEYVIVGTLGEGHFSIVFEAHRKDDPKKRLFALKKIHSQERLHLEMAQREISILKMLNHPNIVQFVDSYESDSQMFIVLEKVSKVLINELLSSRSQKLPERRVASIIKQLVGAIDYCHQKRVVHRDIKPCNILLSDEDHVKLADFGLAIQLPKSGQGVPQSVGTIPYTAPEVLSKEAYDTRADIWSVGVVCYVCIIGKKPFLKVTEMTPHHQIAAFKKASKNIDYKIPAFVSKPAQDLIRKLLKPVPSSRLPLGEVLNSDWILG